MFLLALIVALCVSISVVVVTQLRRDPSWYKHAKFRCSIPNALAITFDDGPGRSTGEIIDKLDALGVKGTFFVNGRTATTDMTRPQTAALVRRAFESGHQIASHTLTHRDLTTLNATEVRDEMLHLEEVLYPVIGMRPRYMRPPYGRLSDLARRVIQALDYQIIIWNIDTNDWCVKHPHDSDASFEQYVKAMAQAPRDASFIALQHDVHPATNAAYVERVVAYAKAAGKRLVRMDECMGAPGTAYASQ
ncbi:hypothetical protein SYNPS1DRAFT_12548 [Syncephalis pseudoplumigaleata]|uniref:NodB homology domain-containing protein n=1 Tax=Syncephalis pseudoplumigaleata TaxID=1712513 RepID=A0A4P9Z600_9FUNG|nr:hypothetical protein SYNPS1DRAFT_12548 [Syncephalis pseudoplumigaleata]|eukprot:RKP27522.1 hypothetical protein SYNPS1DRAFT_12548 [Syncephalis pseudoplumigaleata]